MPMRTHQERLVTMGLGLGVFLVYALGACRSVYVGDSGELTAAVGILGIPHPSGYPLYVMLGHLWTILVPIGSVAYRMSLFSAAAGGAACGLVYSLGRRAGWHRSAAIFAALLLAFSPSYWAEANVQRVYTLNALFIVLATSRGWCWYSTRRDQDLAVAFLVCGLGACNHTFMLVYAVALGLFAVLTAPSIARNIRLVALCAALFALGLLPYAYLPIRSAMNPRLDWGNPETFDAFLGVVFRRDFWDRAWIEGPQDLVVIGLDYARSLGDELFWVGAILAGVGVAVGRRQGFPVLLPLLVMGGNLGSMALHGSRSDLFIWHRYYIPSYIMAALLAGLGAQEIFGRMRRLRWLPLVLPAIMLIHGFRDADRSRYNIAEDFARRVFRALPPGAHISATDDNILFVLIYLHLVERLRPDVDLILQGVGGADLPPLRFDPDADPLFFTHHPNWSLPALDVLPVGPVFRIWRAGGSPPKIDVGEPFLAGELDPRVPKDYLTQNLVGHHHFMRGQTFESMGRWNDAEAEYLKAAAASPNNDVLFYNLGLIYRRAGHLPEAEAAFKRSEAINPRYIASNSKPRAADRIRELEHEMESPPPTPIRAPAPTPAP